MKITRTIALILTAALLAGCGGTSRLLPSTFSSVLDIAPDGAAVMALVRMRIPRRTGRRPEMHPATISSLTQSVAIAVNTAKAQIFNTTPSSPGCAIGSTGTTCTFAVHAKAGTDTFTVTTYAGVNATGTPLDRGIVAKVPIAKGKANHVAVTLGPLVTNAANTGIGSLRYAVGSANDGDTITFLLAKETTITLASPIAINGNVNIAGPGDTDLAISGGNTHQIFQIVGTASISGLTLTHGKAAQSGSPGGAIQNAGTLTLAYDYIGSSTSIEALRRAPRNDRRRHAHAFHPHSCGSVTYVEGGGVYNDGALTVSHTTFNANVLKSDIATCVQAEGGAIFNDVNGTLSSTGDTYTANAAAAGGAVYNAGTGAATFTGDTFTANYGCNAGNGCPNVGCGATACTSYALGEGAAIYDAGTGITVAGSSFTNNVAGGKSAGAIGQGGAIYLNSDVPNISKSTFTGNLAGGGTTSCSGGAGGAIYSTNAFEIDGDTFKNNAAIGDANGTGGAVTGADSVTGTGDAFAGNVASSTGGPCAANAVGAGGAVYSAADIVTFASSTFTGNSAFAGYAAAGGALGGINGIVNDCTFTSNSVLANGAGATQASGGGGAIAFGSYGKISNSTFTENAATVESSVAQGVFGGAVSVASGPFVSTNNRYTSNKAIEKIAANGALGGAVAVLNDELYSTGDTFASNSATGVQGATGGAVAADSGGQINNATVTSNEAIAPQSTGGGIAIGTSGTLTHVIATKNVASGSLAVGGGLFDVAGSSISDSTFSQNSATSAGGGIFAANLSETILSSTIDDNVVAKANFAAAGGGGIFAENGLSLVYSTVAGNTLTVSGPGPAGGAGIFNSGGLVLYESTVSGNTLLGTAPQSGGGGIFSLDQIIALNSTIGNNSSSGYGGGLYNADNAVNELMNVTLFKNAAKVGGNIMNTASGALSLQNTIVGGGTASTGPDIDNPGSITSADYNIIQTTPAGTAITTMSHDLITDPKLLALSNNGGPTWTNADQPTSPGRGRIPFSSSECAGVPVPTDQRGYTRGASGHCDVGAFEYAGVATAIARRPNLPKHAFRHNASHYRLPVVKVPFKQPSVRMP